MRIASQIYKFDQKRNENERLGQRNSQVNPNHTFQGYSVDYLRQREDLNRILQPPTTQQK